MRRPEDRDMFYMLLLIVALVALAIWKPVPVPEQVSAHTIAEAHWR